MQLARWKGVTSERFGSLTARRCLTPGPLARRRRCVAAPPPAALNGGRARDQQAAEPETNTPPGSAAGGLSGGLPGFPGGVTAAAAARHAREQRQRLRQRGRDEAVQAQHEERQRRAREEAKAAAVRALLAKGPAGLARCRSLATLQAVAEHWAARAEEPGGDWWRAFERQSRALLSGADPLDAANLLAAALGGPSRPSADWLATVQSDLAAAAERGGGGGGIEPWAAALPALARAGVAVDHRLAAAVLAATGPRLAAAPPGHLIQLLWGTAKARLAPPPRWLDAARAAAEAGAGLLTASQLARCIRSLAVLSEGSAAGAAEGLRATAALLADELAARPGGAGPGELAMALWGLARLQARAGAGGVCPVSALLPLIEEQLPRLTPSQLSSLLWALPKLGAAVDRPLARLLAEELSAAMADPREDGPRPGLTNREFSQAAWGVAKLAGPALLSPHFLERFSYEAERRAGGLAPGETTLLLWAVERFGMHGSPPAWIEAVLDASEGALPSYRPDQLVNCAVALGRLGAAAPPSWLAALEGAARPHLAALELQDLINLLWSFSELGHSPSVPWQHACVAALGGACARASSAPEPFGTDRVAALLEDAGLAGLVGAALAAQCAAARGDGGGPPVVEAPPSLGVAFEPPLGAL